MQKDFEAFIGQGEQAQGRSWRLTKESFFCVSMQREKKKKKEKCVREIVFSFYVWRGAHGKCVCRNQA